MKKIVGIISAICILAMQFTAYAADTLYFNEGGITIEDNAPTVRPGEKVTLLVTPSTVDWLDEAVREAHNGEDVVYFGEATVAADGCYGFNFYLPENGKYNVYITEGNEPTLNEKPSIVKQIFYINKTRYEAAVLALRTAVQNSSQSDTTQIAQALNDYDDDLGLYDKIFEDVNVNYGDASQIAYSELAVMTEYEPLRTIEIFEKAVISDMLNDSYGETINKYGYILYADNSLYEESDAQVVYNYMKGKDIKNIKELDKLSDEAIVVAKANSGDSTKINSALKDIFADKLYPQYARKISLTLSSKISQRNNWTIESLENYIRNYSEPAGNGPSVIQGGGGGGAVTPNVAVVPTQNQELSEFMPFTDIENVEWAQEAIIGLYDKGCISGRGDGVFAPYDNVSREEFLKILISMFDLELIGAEALPFDDTDENAWYFNYVKTAFLAGVTKGISENLFGIGQSITRQDLCKMTANLTDALGKNFEKKCDVSFKDDSYISEYAKDAVYMLAEAGIVSGNENGEFNPSAKATRAEAAKILYYTMTFVK